MYTLKPTLWKIRRTIIFSRYWRKITFACKFHFFERLKSVRNDLKLSSHSPMDRMKKKSVSLIKYNIKVTCAFKWARKLTRKTVFYESAKCVPCNIRKCTHNGFVSDLLWPKSKVNTLYLITFKSAMFCRINNSSNEYNHDTFPPSIMRVSGKIKVSCSWI